VRLKGVVYDIGRAMGALSLNWRPDYSPALMRRELDIIQTDLHANAVRLGGRDPGCLLEAAEYAASIGLQVLVGPELWNATPQRTLRFITTAAAAAEPLFQRFPQQLTFCVGNELTLFMRGIVPGLNHARAADPRAAPAFGFASCRDADNPQLLGMFNATSLSLLAAHLPVVRRSIQPRVRTVHPRDESAQSQHLVDQLQLLDQADVDGAFVMCFSFTLAPSSDDQRHDIDATSLSIVRSLPHGQRGTTYPDMAWEPKQAFHAIASYYASHATTLNQEHC
jgi:hypothetical protein